MNTEGFEEKDVIDVDSGRRIGCVTALEFDPCDGRVYWEMKNQLFA